MQSENDNEEGNSNRQRANPPLLTIDFLRGFKSAIEYTILFHQWLKEDKFLKRNLLPGENGEDSRALWRVKKFLELFKEYIVRKGNRLKTPKFHQLLHIVDYILRHGSPSNWDGSRSEHFGKLIVKDNAKLTNHQKDTLNFDISKRLYNNSVNGLLDIAICVL